MLQEVGATSALWGFLMQWQLFDLSNFKLPDVGVVDVWRCPYDTKIPHVIDVESLFSEAEMIRYRAFSNRDARLRYVKARWFVRRVLSRYMFCDLKALEFRFGSHGKPGLAGEDRDVVSFNLSHAGEWLLMAVTSVGALGVDIEKYRVNRDVMAIAARYFTPFEVKALEEIVGVQEQRVAFYRAWVRKEAFVKAVGVGLSYPLAGFEVEIGRAYQSGNCLKKVFARDVDNRKWYVQDINLPNMSDQYFSAVALEGRISQVRYWEIPAC